MEFYAIIKHDNKIYSWVEHPGSICDEHCDLVRECRSKVHLDLYDLCRVMRSVVGSSTTHRFKEVHLET